MASECETPVAEVRRLFHEFGASEYGGEAVSQLEHALQAAFFAEREAATPSLITAALLHDVGHLLHALPADAPDHGIDDRHEWLAATWLDKRFGPAVVEPVKMHVDAKRYLCAVDSDYYRQLSHPSQVSLRLQGGAMDETERRQFESSPFHQDAVRLRRWDDGAKVVGLKTPDLEHFLHYVASADTVGET